MSDSSKDVAALERSLPSLVAKLKALSDSLSPEEKAVFKEIVESAAKHTELVNAHSQGDPALANAKPMSVHSTASMKKEFMNLKKTLGL